MAMLESVFRLIQKIIVWIIRFTHTQFLEFIAVGCNYLLNFSFCHKELLSVYYI